jgi:hypothetical protein
MQARAYLIVGTILALFVAVGTVLLLTTHTTALPPARPMDAAAPSSAGATVLVASSTIPAGRTILATAARSLFAPITLAGLATLLLWLGQRRCGDLPALGWVAAGDRAGGPARI